ncbi:MAG: hypothetical protein K2H71_04270, partial [Muribaculaceae bacterium]|nr:hypothetical protein [Muribaculaceae bacterium]
MLVPSVAYVAVVVALGLTKDTRQGMLNILIWLTLCVFFPTLLFTVVSLIGKGIGLAFPSAVRFVDMFGAAVALVWLGISLYGVVYGWKKVTVDRVAVSSPLIPQS